jgi:Tfp pilus assembly protein PilF
MTLQCNEPSVGRHTMNRIDETKAVAMAALRKYPNRYRGLQGAAQAAQAAGQRDKAADYYRRLVALAKDADSTRPEIGGAKAFLAAR